ncbi:MAG: hypothetical protein AAF628_38325 [Planctomycetota bacterium]
MSSSSWRRGMQRRRLLLGVIAAAYVVWLATAFGFEAIARHRFGYPAIAAETPGSEGYAEAVRRRSQAAPAMKTWPPNVVWKWVSISVVATATLVALIWMLFHWRTVFTLLTRPLASSRFSEFLDVPVIGLAVGFVVGPILRAAAALAFCLPAMVVAVALVGPPVLFLRLFDRLEPSVVLGFWPEFLAMEPGAVANYAVLTLVVALVVGRLVVTFVGSPSPAVDGSR